MIILDASAAVELVLSRTNAHVIEKHILEADTVAAPDLFVAEVTNVFWKYHRAGVPLADCEKACQKAMLLVDVYLPTFDYSREALNFAVKHTATACDSFYAVMASLNNALLVTLDAKLQRVARNAQIDVA